MRAGLDLLPTWALEQKAIANRQVIAATRQRLAAGEQVARMYQEPGLAWLERHRVAEEPPRMVAAENTIMDGKGMRTRTPAPISSGRDQGALGDSRVQSQFSQPQPSLSRSRSNSSGPSTRTVPCT